MMGSNIIVAIETTEDEAKGKSLFYLWFCFLYLQLPACSQPMSTNITWKIPEINNS
jgi:hypothetical protein